MKKAAAFLIAILFLVTCAFAESADTAAGKSISSMTGLEKAGYPGAEHYGADYLNAKLIVEPWPQLPENGIPVFYEETACLVLPLPGETYAPYLYNTETGKRTNLYYYEEDLPRWKELVMGNMAQLGFTEEDVEEYSGGYYVDYYFFMVRGQDTLTSMNILSKEIVINYMTASFVIDLNEFTISPADADIMMGGGISVDWLGEPDVDYIYTDAAGKATAVKLTGDPGYEYTPYCIDFEWDAVAITVHDAKKYSGNADFALGFAGDYTGGELEFVNLGTYSARSGPSMARLCGHDAALAYNKSSLIVYPLLLARRGSEHAQALIWDGEIMNAVDVTELIGANGTVSMADYDYRYLYPLEVSDDGRYAVFIESGNGDLLVMDTQTLETRCLMTQAEMDAAGYGNMMHDLSGWFIGDIILGTNGYNLRFVFE